MAFGQPTGPPATHKQLQYLESLVRQAGHGGFRDARYPLGLTQRQASGKFSRDEASALIDQLLGAAEDEVATGAPAAAEDGAATAPPATPPAAAPKQARTIAEVPTEALVRELRRRGWTVTEPG